ncbi:excinuclease ABC subunit UvrB [Candidatus Kaiserbacteria bacterium]|nr:excinuclease ABC subunit UvrB [Candidatus Kaiserbacteria bacterium]
MEGIFKLKSAYEPAGDQPQAIRMLVEGLRNGARHQTLLGVTGSGKTFTIANVIEAVQKPTLVIAHNKTLAAQLAAEYREFFPDNAVHYFVSYYDYYQPEAYMPVTDTFIEKEAMVNEDIERLRHAATQALLTRKDVIIVASVSCIYGLGSPEEYEKVNMKIVRGDTLTRAAFTRQLVSMYFERVAGDLSPGTFRALGSGVEVMPANERVIYRIDLSGGTIAKIEEIDAITRAIAHTHDSIFIFPAKHYVTPKDVQDAAVADIEAELKEQLTRFDASGKILEAERLKRRTRQDIAMIREFGYCNGIENYSRHFDRRQPGEPAHTLLSYFPHLADGAPDFLTVIDESHVTVPQIGGMYAGDRARKETLIEHGFRLPSAVDNRPLKFEEFEQRVGATIYTSATPGKYELEHSEKPIEQVIRPTGLVDPEIIMRPIVSGPARSDLADLQQGRTLLEYPGQVKDFIAEAEKVTKRGARSMVTVLTKKMAEDLTTFLTERQIRARYIHSDVKTIERIEILTDFRKGVFDVLVGVNLLREGLDLPEVELVGILDADKEGFLRSETSLIQTIGRAARNVAGRVIVYADSMTGSLQRAVDETNRRRAIQIAYNEKHGITPKTIASKIKDIVGDIQKARTRAVDNLAETDMAAYGGDVKKLIKAKRTEMHAAADALDFETAALLRDEIARLETQMNEGAKKTKRKGAK